MTPRSTSRSTSARSASSGDASSATCGAAASSARLRWARRRPRRAPAPNTGPARNHLGDHAAVVASHTASPISPTRPTSGSTVQPVDISISSVASKSSGSAMATRITRRGPGAVDRRAGSAAARRPGRATPRAAASSSTLSRRRSTRGRRSRVRQRRGQRLVGDAADLDRGARQADAVVARVAAHVAQPRLVDQPRLDEHVLDGAAHGRSAAGARDVLLDALGDGGARGRRT